MPQIEIRKDSKLVQLITAQARGERVDSDQADKAAKQIAELASDPTPHNKYAIGQLVGYTVNEMTRPQTNWLNHVADVKHVGYGEKAAFQVKMDGIRAFIMAKAGTPARSKVAHKQVTLDTIAVSARPVINLYEVRPDRVLLKVA